MNKRVVRKTPTIIHFFGMFLSFFQVLSHLVEPKYQHILTGQRWEILNKVTLFLWDSECMCLILLDSLYNCSLT